MWNRSSPSLISRVCAPGAFQQLLESLVSLTQKQSVCPPPRTHLVTTHCNPWFSRVRAWLNNEIKFNVGGGRCCTHLFGPWCSPAMRAFFADAHRLTRKCWWMVLVVKRRTQQPTHPPINTHQPVPTRSPCKVCSLSN